MCITLKNSVHEWEGGLPQCMLGYHPPGKQTPPWQGRPPSKETPTPPDKVEPPLPVARQTPPARQTSPGKADLPPRAVHAGRYGQQAGGMHPTGMQSCFDRRASFRMINKYILCQERFTTLATSIVMQSCRIKQENIPVGCVPPAFLVPRGVCPTPTPPP